MKHYMLATAEAEERPVLVVIRLISGKSSSGRKTGGSIKAKCGNIFRIDCAELLMVPFDKRAFNGFIKIL